MDNTKEKVTIYITKYALTAGIYKREGELFSPDLGGYSFKHTPDHYPTHVYGKDAHLTEEAALSRAEEMRIAKLKSLEKQMKKVSAMKFEVR